MAKSHLELSNDFQNDWESLDQFRKRLGHYPSEDEYKGWIKPRIQKSYDEFVNSGYDRNHIRSELTDAYYYPDLINEIMGGSEDDDWFAEMKTKTSFPQGIFRPEIDDWDKLKNELSFLSPDELWPTLRHIAKQWGNRYKGGK